MAYWVLFFLIAIVALAYIRAGIRTVTLVLAAVVLFYGAFGGSWLVFGLLLGLGTVVLLPLNLSPLREEWLARPLFARFRRLLGRLDERQLSALTEAGTGWEAQLFDGAPDWARFHADYGARLTPDERALLDEPLAEFCRRYARDPDDREANARLRAYGLHGLAVGSLHGGRDLSALAQSAALARLAAGAGRAVALKLGATGRLAWIDALRRFGTPAQQSRWLPRLAAGAVLTTLDEGRIAGDACVEIGPDGARLSVQIDDAVPTDAELVGLVVDLRDPDHRLGRDLRCGPTWLLLEAETLRGDAPDGRRLLELDSIVGGLARIGLAARHSVESLAVAEAVAPIAIHAGAATALALAAGRHARERGPFEAALGARPAAEEALAVLASRAWAAQALAVACARAVDLGEKPFAAAAFARTLALQHARDRAAAARDLGLDRTVLAAQVAGVEDPDRDGAEPTLLARPEVYSACVLRSHGAFMAALAAANDPNPAQALARFDAALGAHVGHLAATAIRAFGLALTRGSRLFSSSGPEAQIQRQINRYSAALAFAADVALSLLARELGAASPYTALRAMREAARRSLTGWLGDALAQLYLASAAVRQFDEGGAQPDERAVLELICTDAFSACDDALDQLIRHLSSPLLATLVRVITMPLGASRRAPRDAIRKTVAQNLQLDGRLRERLAERVAMPADASPWPLLADSERCRTAAEPYEARMLSRPQRCTARHVPTRVAAAQASGLIDEDEARALNEWLAASRRLRLAEGGAS